MKIGLVGLTGAGKTTVFEALTKSGAGPAGRSEDRLSVIRVPDQRITILSDMYHPRKTIDAQVAYYLGSDLKTGSRDTQWQAVKECDALLHVVRNFPLPGLNAPRPFKDMTTLEEEFILSDLMITEKRLERIEADKKKGKPVEAGEITVLGAARQMLEAGKPLRKNPDISESPHLRGYSLVTAKPVLVLINNDDGDTEAPSELPSIEATCLVVQGRLEQELARMSNDEAAEFLKEFDISEPVVDRVIRSSYELLGLISFFTVGEDEVRAWTIKKGTPALKAAGVIHSDMEKGFIRAEVVAYDDLITAGSYAEARKKGTTRLEGKTYEMKDGDIVNFRFNV